MKQINLLDSGYLKYVEHWGSDASIIEAARMSTNKGFKGWGPRCDKCDGTSVMNGPVGEPEPWCGDCEAPCEIVSGDEKLLAYLYRNKHSTPFEMAGLTIEVQAPLFVFRQWHRHRTQSYNEMSARYTPLPVEDYVPTVERCIVVNGSNKQAGKDTGRTPTHEEVLQWLQELQDSYDHSQRVYDRGLEIGIPKELARLPVPVARYSRMRASANLRNWLGFLTLRMDSHAQHEIQVFAEAAGSIIAEKFPRTWELFMEGKR